MIKITLICLYQQNATKIIITLYINDENGNTVLESSNLNSAESILMKFVLFDNFPRKILVYHSTLLRYRITGKIIGLT